MRIRELMMSGQGWMTNIGESLPIKKKKWLKGKMRKITKFSMIINN